MPVVDVRFDLPPDLGSALERGEFVRDGGVVVDAATRRVVCWLNEVEPVGVEGVDAAVELLTAGASAVIRAGTSLQMARIQETLAAIGADVTEVLEISRDELAASARAGVEDFQRRARVGVAPDFELLRHLRQSSVRLAGCLRRMCSEGVPRARNRGSFLQEFLPIPEFYIQRRIDERAGRLGVILTEVFSLYLATKWTEGVVLATLSPDELPVWRQEFGQVAGAVGRAIPACAADRWPLAWQGDHPVCPGGGFWWEFARGTEPIPAPLLLGMARELGGRAGAGSPNGAVPVATRPKIAAGLLLAAEILDINSSGGLEHEAIRMQAHLGESARRALSG